VTPESFLDAGRAAAPRFLPYRTISDWLEPDRSEALLDYAIASEARYKVAPILYQGGLTVDPGFRCAVTLTSLGSFADPLRARALALKPELEKAFGTPAFSATDVEIELVAHGDGAHFTRHIDTFVVLNRSPSPRILTLVLYLHRRPRQFSGGALRFYALGSSSTVDVLPENNLLAAFPSIAPHSVEPIACPSGAFSDRRFAINIWIHG